MIGDEVPYGIVIHVFHAVDREGSAVKTEFVVEHHFHGHPAFQVDGIHAGLVYGRVVKDPVFIE